MIKTTGSEFKRFYHDPWPINYFCDGEIVFVDGVEVDPDNYESIDDSASVALHGGVIYSDEDFANEVCSMETYFRRWKKAQTSSTLIVEIDKTKVDELKEIINQLGGKIK